MTSLSASLDGRTLAIGVLSITACILFVGLLLIVSMPTPAQAIGMNDSAGDYKMATQQLTSSTEGVIVIDAAAKRMILYGFDYNRRQVVPLSAFDLAQLPTPGPREAPRGPRSP